MLEPKTISKCSTYKNRTHINETCRGFQTYLKAWAKYNHTIHKHVDCLVWIVLFVGMFHVDKRVFMPPTVPTHSLLNYSAAIFINTGSNATVHYRLTVYMVCNLLGIEIHAIKNSRVVYIHSSKQGCVLH